MTSTYGPYLRTGIAASTRPGIINGLYSTFPSAVDVAPPPAVWQAPVQTRCDRRRASSSATPCYDNLPRPPNCFILFRSHYYRTFAQNHARSLSPSASGELAPSIKQNDLSTEAAGVWKTMSEEEKAPFRAEAHRLKKEYSNIREMHFTRPPNSRRSTRSPTLPPAPVYAPVASPTPSPNTAGLSAPLPYTFIPSLPAFYPESMGTDGQTSTALFNDQHYPPGAVPSSSAPAFSWSPYGGEGSHLDVALPYCDFDLSDYLQDCAMADAAHGVAPSYIACEEPQTGFDFGGSGQFYGYPFPELGLNHSGSHFVWY